MTRQRGFTLLEMALVVALIGLLVGGGVVAIAPLTLQAKTNQTNTAMDQIEAALVVFAIRNNRLPCPADGSLTSASASYGIEGVQSGNAGDATDAGSNNCPVAATNSVIPWRTLGLDENYSVDGWSDRVAYFPAVPNLDGTATGWGTLVDAPTTAVNCLNRITLTTAPPQGFRSVKGTAASACDLANAITSGTYGGSSGYNIPTYPFGNYIAVYSISNGDCSSELTQPNTDNAAAAYSGTDTCASVSAAVTPSSSNVMFNGLRAAYVLISHGPSGWYGWPKGGSTQVPPPSGLTYKLKKYNSGAIANMAGTPGNLGFVQGQPQGGTTRNNAGYYDDIVRWRSPAFIIQQCGSAACGNP